VVTLARKPYSWVYTSHDWFPIEQLDQALASERGSTPQVTERDLKRVDGEMVRVTIQVPGARPIQHVFLVAPGSRRTR
jgi:hypothetical protein